jgi:hypothetical protein
LFQKDSVKIGLIKLTLKLFLLLLVNLHHLLIGINSLAKFKQFLIISFVLKGSLNLMLLRF